MNYSLDWDDKNEGANEYVAPASVVTIPTAAIEAARDAMRDKGIDIALPWEGDLDDLESERFDALCYSILAARPHLIARVVGALDALEQHFSKRAEDYEAMRAAGRLTKDWGECARVAAHETLKDFRRIRDRETGMVDLVTQLREAKDRRFHPGSLRTMVLWGADEIEELRDLVQTLLDNDPSTPIADNGMTVLDGWRERARKHLQK